MNLDEFNSFVNSFVDQNEYPIRENPYYFNVSLQLQISEIHGERHLNMYFPEFLEAACRAIDKASPIPQGESVDEWPLSRRSELHLALKLENIISTLTRTITHPEYVVLKTKFTFPTKDPSTGLFIIDYENNPYYTSYPILSHVK